MVYKEKIHITNTSSTFRIHEIKRKDIENETKRERERDLYETMVFLCIVVLLLHFFLLHFTVYLTLVCSFFWDFYFFDLVLIYMQFYILIVTYLMNRQYIIISLYLSIITIILILLIIN